MNNKQRYLKKNYSLIYNALYHHRTHTDIPLRFSGGYEYLIEFYKMPAHVRSVRKSTQSTFTEYCTAFVIDRTIKGQSVFYVLPTETLVSRYVKNRFDKTMEYTKYYQDFIGGNLKKFAENTKLKHIANGAITFVASNSRNQFAEFPADVLVIDEIDECNQENLIMAIDRLSNSKIRDELYIGNPTVAGFGISKKYEESSQAEYMVKCKSCGEWQPYDFFKNIVQKISDSDFILLDSDYKPDEGRDINVICSNEKCRAVIDRRQVGEWVHRFPNIEHKGYQINKIFTSQKAIKELTNRFSEGFSNNETMQTFYNADLGLPYISSESKITIDILNNAKSDYSMPSIIDKQDFRCCIGIDVGKKLHVFINQILPSGHAKAVFIGSCVEAEDIYLLWERFNCVIGIVDALPETRLSKKLATRLNIFMAEYTDSVKDTVDAKTRIVRLNRTQSLDAVKENLILGFQLLPKNADTIPEYYDHMQAGNRVYDKKMNKYRWIEVGADHLHHAQGYCLKAEKILKLS